ncbi:MAG: hypothetical protein GEV03_21260 [Streptosporangiales bacterium]|nr:hypothetical protein [Streptosporangiales bacterium]
MSGARLPNFVFLGPDKTGSTWLHAALSRHPLVYLAPGKDLHFFDRYFDRGVEWYAAQFRGAGPRHRIVGEIGTRYLYARRAAERIHRTVPDARLMVCVRDPVKRAFSSFLYLRRQGKNVGTFAEVLDTTPVILDRCRYATHLQQYLSRFGQDRIYLGVFDDLQKDPQRYLDGVTTWLSLDPIGLPPEILKPQLPASQARSRRLGRFVSRTARKARNRGLTLAVTRVKDSAVVQRTLYRPLAEDRPQLTAQDAERIRAELDPEIRRLEELFGVDLRQRWGWA